MRLRVALTVSGGSRHATAGSPAGARQGHGGFVTTLCGHTAKVPEAQGKPVTCANCKRHLREIKLQAEQLLGEADA
jgi:hypothetical protein